jgi:esterase/lipase
MKKTLKASVTQLTADSSAEKPRRAIVIINGIDPDPAGILSMAEYFGRISGAKVFLLTFAKRDTEAKKSYLNWIRSINSRLDKIFAEFREVHLIGFSCGGLVALEASFNHRLASLTLVNVPARFFNIKNIARRPLFSIKMLAEYMIKVSVSSTREMTKLGKFVLSNLKKCRAKTLVIQTGGDICVDFNGTKFLYDRLTCEKQIKFFPRGEHAFFDDPYKTFIFDYAAKFISEKSGDPEKNEVSENERR